MSVHETFNRSAFSHFINSSAGRVFRLAAGSAFLVGGFVFRAHSLGMISLVWSIFPLTAGGFDLCYISAALGGPLSGKAIRQSYGKDRAPQAPSNQRTNPSARHT